MENPIHNGRVFNIATNNIFNRGCGPEFCLISAPILHPFSKKMGLGSPLLCGRAIRCAPSSAER